jgi:hypothetical protein
VRLVIGSILATMLGRKAPCRCGCGRVLRGQARRFSEAGANIRDTLERLDEVVGPAVRQETPQRERLEQLQRDGRVIETDLFRVAHGGQSSPRLTVEEIDSWMAAATGLIASAGGYLART